MPLAPLTATASVPPCCAPVAMGDSAPCCGKACCANNPAPNSKPAPAVPAKTGGQDQISLLASTIFVLTLPAGSPSAFSLPVISSSLAHAPIYARDCALRL